MPETWAPENRVFGGDDRFFMILMHALVDLGKDLKFAKDWLRCKGLTGFRINLHKSVFKICRRVTHSRHDLATWTGIRSCNATWHSSLSTAPMSIVAPTGQSCSQHRNFSNCASISSQITRRSGWPKESNNGIHELLVAPDVASYWPRHRTVNNKNILLSWHHLATIKWCT